MKRALWLLVGVTAILLTHYGDVYGTAYPKACGVHFSCNHPEAPDECDNCVNFIEGAGVGHLKWTIEKNGPAGFHESGTWCSGTSLDHDWWLSSVAVGDYTVSMTTPGAKNGACDCVDDTRQYGCTFDITVFDGNKEVEQTGPRVEENPIRKLKLVHGPITPVMKVATYTIAKSNSSTATLNISLDWAVRAALSAKLGISSSVTTTWSQTFQQPFSECTLGWYLGNFYNQFVWHRPIRYRNWDTYFCVAGTWVSSTAWDTLPATVWSQQAANQTALYNLESQNANVSLSDSTSLSIL